MGTYMAKPAEIEKKWYVLDAAGKPLGRVASEAARLLRGKHKPIFTPHIDTGANVIVINAEKAVFTGKKDERKIYQTYTGYRSGLKETTPQKLRESDPTRIIKSAVWGMLPHGRLGRAQFRKLKVYAGAEYPQVAQKPVKVTVEK